jgi:hypothetical protein
MDIPSLNTFCSAYDLEFVESGVSNGRPVLIFEDQEFRRGPLTEDRIRNLMNVNKATNSHLTQVKRVEQIYHRLRAARARR